MSKMEKKRQKQKLYFHAWNTVQNANEVPINQLRLVDLMLTYDKATPC